MSPNSEDAPTGQAPEEARQDDGRRRTTGIVAGGLAFLLLVAVVGVGVVFAVRGQSDGGTLSQLPRGVAALGGPVVVGNAQATTKLAVWEDFQCPACGDVARGETGQRIDAGIADGSLQVSYHVVSFLDRGAVGPSSRAANAAYCASGQDRFLQFHQWAFARQPTENGSGYTVDELIASGPQIGIADQDSFATCIREQSYSAQVSASTSSLVANGIQGTPTIFENGQKVMGP